MRKIKQVDRPYLVFRYGLVGRTLFDSCTSLIEADGVAQRQAKKHPGEKYEVYYKGNLVLSHVNDGAGCSYGYARSMR